MKPQQRVVLEAFRSYTYEYDCVFVTRDSFLREHLAEMVATGRFSGRTPAQTVSRVLQELRDMGCIEFYSRGVYRLI